MGWADALANNIGLFYAAVLNGTACDERQEYATFADARDIMKLVDACLESDKKEGWVSLK